MGSKHKPEAKITIFEDAAPVMVQNDPLDKQGFLDKVGDTFAADLFPSDWTPAQVSKGSSELFDHRFANGLWSKIPMICRTGCPHEENGQCKLSNRPRGDRCPEEAAYVELLMSKYLESLNIPFDDISQVSLVRDLVDVEIQQLRKQGTLARQDLIIEQTVGTDRQGNELTQIIENPILITDERLSKRKGVIMKQLLASREAQAKAMTDVVNAGSMAKAAEALKKLSEAQERGEIADSFNEDFKDDFVDNE